MVSSKTTLEPSLPRPFRPLKRPRTSRTNEMANRERRVGAGLKRRGAQESLVRRRGLLARFRPAQDAAPEVEQVVDPQPRPHRGRRELRRAGSRRRCAFRNGAQTRSEPRACGWPRGSAKRGGEVSLPGGRQRTRSRHPAALRPLMLSPPSSPGLTCRDAGVTQTPHPGRSPSLSAATIGLSIPCRGHP
jgi:hypothetical protein